MQKQQRLDSKIAAKPLIIYTFTSPYRNTPAHATAHILQNYLKQQVQKNLLKAGSIWFQSIIQITE